MINLSRHAVLFGLALGALGAVSAGCSTSSGTPATTIEPTPQTSIEITSPLTGVTVKAAISAVTLGDECGTGARAAPTTGDCAMLDAGPDGASSTPPSCGGPAICQQSNVQIAFDIGKGARGATVTVVEVTLHDAKTEAKVDTLEASSPRSWTGSAYAPWDQTLLPSAQLKASYNLTAPAWSTISNGASSYAQQYRLHVTLEIDGVRVILESAILNREPAVAT